MSYLAFHLEIHLVTPTATMMATRKEWNSDLRLETKWVHQSGSHLEKSLVDPKDSTTVRPMVRHSVSLMETTTVSLRGSNSDLRLETKWVHQSASHLEKN